MSLKQELRKISMDISCLTAENQGNARSVSCRLQAGSVIFFLKEVEDQWIRQR